VKPQDFALYLGFTINGSIFAGYAYTAALIKAVVMTATRKCPIPHLALGRGCHGSRPSSAARSRLRCCRGCGCDRLRFFAGCSATATETKLFGKPRSAFRIAGRGDCMFTRQVPASPILVDAQSVAACEMPPERQASPATIEADDIIAVNGLPD
jgi:hypothetical protein